MTIEQVRVLTDDALRVEIAKALGKPNGYCRYDSDGTLMEVAFLPDWPRSLDACAELRGEIEKRDLWWEYAAYLIRICRSDGDWRLLSNQRLMWIAANATARQHSAAALLALGGRDGE